MGSSSLTRDCTRPPALGCSLSPWTIWEFQPPALSMSHNVRKEEILWLWCTLLSYLCKWNNEENKNKAVMSTFLVPVLHPQIWLITLLITGVNHGGLGCGSCSPDFYSESKHIHRNSVGLWCSWVSPFVPFKTLPIVPTPVRQINKAIESEAWEKLLLQWEGLWVNEWSFENHRRRPVII